MENYIIIAMIILAAVFGIRSSLKHFKGQGGCCEGGDYKIKKKRLKNVMYKKTFKVEGMKCKKCKARVEEIVNDIDGVSGKADLKKGELTVSYAEDVADDIIKAQIERAGYTLSEKGCTDV